MELFWNCEIPKSNSQKTYKWMFSLTYVLIPSSPQGLHTGGSRTFCFSLLLFVLSASSPGYTCWTHLCVWGGLIHFMRTNHQKLSIKSALSSLTWSSGILSLHLLPLLLTLNTPAVYKEHTHTHTHFYTDAPSAPRLLSNTFTCGIYRKKKSPPF